MYSIITENDESDWLDETGELYHFPKRYAKYLSPGTDVIYYKGKLKKSKYKEYRLSSEPHYFGTGMVHKVYTDKSSKKGDLFATITNYKAFETPVLAKMEGSYLEQIPENLISNYWRNAVRPISRETY